MSRYQGWKDHTDIRPNASLWLQLTRAYVDSILTGKCNCTTAQIRKYFGRISRPILDRIDICTETVSLNYDELENRGEEESSAQIRERVMEAQKFKQNGTKEKAFGTMEN